MWKYLSARSCENKTRHDRAARGREAWGSWGSQLCWYVIRIFQIVPQCAVSITSNTHFLPHLVPMSPGSWSFNLFSVFAPDDSVSVSSCVQGSGVGLLGLYLCDGAEGGRGLQLDWATFTFTCCCWHQMAARSRDGNLDAWPYITAAAAHQHRA